ncbi:thiamine pyrophosphokinase [Echinicola salinicaeni]|uniref:thiamine pyrophosphokinase n=1 Tax=Echinicola salinicaeni TaxID=2762757 RepID=UPI00164618E7|nr:thiamine pyrophosphokinase [Echinicola salinicaeni]
MSSHHFVKEQQEPALLILDTQDYRFTQLSSLLEWVPTVIIAQDAIETVISWGIKIDIILASPEYQRENLHLLEEQYPIKFLTVKNGDFLDEGLQYLIASKHSAVNIIGYDHKKAFDLEEKLDFLNMVIFDGPIRYFPVKEKSFKKWFPVSSLQIHAPEDSLVEMKTTNESQLIKISHATFVETEEGIVTFNAMKPFWIGEMI